MLSQCHGFSVFVQFNSKFTQHSQHSLCIWFHSCSQSRWFLIPSLTNVCWNNIHFWIKHLSNVQSLLCNGNIILYFVMLRWELLKQYKLKSTWSMLPSLFALDYLHFSTPHIIFRGNVIVRFHLQLNFTRHFLKFLSQ